MNNTFRDRYQVKTKSLGEQLKEDYNIIKDNMDFTEKLMLAIGSEVARAFPGASTEFKVREKSEKSRNAKIAHLEQTKKNNDESDLNIPNSAYKIYDWIGGKIVILDVPDDFKSEYVPLDAYLKKRSISFNELEDKSKILNIFKEKNQHFIGYENYLKNSELVIPEENGEDIFTETYSNYVAQNHDNTSLPANVSYEGFLHFRESLSDKIDSQNAYRKNYEKDNYLCKLYVSNAIHDFIINDEYLKDAFGIRTVEHRNKTFNTEQEYIAQHITLESTKLPGWCMEMQFKTSEDYTAARNGPAAHYNRKEKDRELPPNFDFDKIDYSVLPHYFIYIDPETIYEAGDFENAYHYYQDQLDDNAFTCLMASNLPSKIGTKKHFDKDYCLDI